MCQILVDIDYEGFESEQRDSRAVNPYFFLLDGESCVSVDILIH